MTNGTKARILSVALAAALTPGLAQAQACIGEPEGSHGALTGGVYFPEHGTTYAVEGSGHAADHLILSAGFSITTPDVDGLENEKGVHGRAAYELPSLHETASVCPTVGIGYEWVEELNLLTVPFGIAIGKTLPLGEGDATLTPFAEPRFIYARLSVDGFDELDDSDTHFGLGAGATVGIGQILLGASIATIFEDDADAVFGVYGGFAF